MLIALLPKLPSVADDWETYTGSNGVEIRGQIIEVFSGKVEIRVLRQDGNSQVYTLPLSKFSPDSQLTIVDTWRAREDKAMPAEESKDSENVVEPVGESRIESKGQGEDKNLVVHPFSHETLNEAFGVPLFDDNGFRDDDPKEVFARLSLEPKTDGRHACLESLFGENKEVLGLLARTVEIHGDSEEGTHRISFLFSNMQTRERGLASGDIRSDFGELMDVITDAVGEPEELTKFSPPDTELFLWRTENVAFLMSYSRNEFTFLDIFNVTATGNIEYLKVNSMPVRRGIGVGDDQSFDVILRAEIHRQGSMNCYPTTATMVMNQAGIPVNPYMVGAAVITDDGGTNDANLMAGIEEILDEMEDKGAEEPFGRAGYRLDSGRGEMSFENVVEHIDSGRAIFVSTYFMEGFEPYLESYERLRISPNPSKEMEKDVRYYRSRISYGDGHAGAILGYNKERGDIYYADPNLRPGWMEFDVFVDYIQGLYAVVRCERN